MSLRDTLKKAQNRVPSNLTKSQLITDWQASLGKLEEKIREWLREYEEDKLVKITSTKTLMLEADLGNYEVNRLNIDFGNYTIFMDPVGRVIVGGVGRVDLYRKDIPSEADKYLMLRQLNEEDAESWVIQKVRAFDGLASIVVRDFVELNKPNFEAVIERLALRR